MSYDLSLLVEDIEVIRHIENSQSPISSPPLEDEEYLNLINQIKRCDKHAKSFVNPCKQPSAI